MSEHDTSFLSRGRDAQAARAAAEQRVRLAQQVADAVAHFHDAADRIDAAQASLRAATGERTDALHRMRSCGMSITEMSSLTGLSTSRIQALLRAAE